MAGATAPAVFLWDLLSNSSQEGHCSRDRGSRRTGLEAGALTSTTGSSPRQTPEPLNPAPSLLYLGPKRARCSDSGGTGSWDRTCPLSPPDGRAFGHRRPQSLHAFVAAEILHVGSRSQVWAQGREESARPRYVLFAFLWIRPGEVTTKL